MKVYEERHARRNSLLKYKFPGKNENVPKVADLKIQQLNISSRRGRKLKVSKSNLAAGGSSNACIVFLVCIYVPTGKFACNISPPRSAGKKPIVLMSIIYSEEEIEGWNRTSQNPTLESESNPLMRSALSLFFIIFRWAGTADSCLVTAIVNILFKQTPALWIDLCR